MAWSVEYFEVVNVLVEEVDVANICKEGHPKNTVFCSSRFFKKLTL